MQSFLPKPRRFFAPNVHGWMALGRRQKNAFLMEFYRTIIHQVRDPLFYRDATVSAEDEVVHAQSETRLANYGVRDDFAGRFDVLILHCGAFVRALSAASEPCAKIASAFVTLIMAQLDVDLREMGVGDAAIPKKMAAMLEAFYGRLGTYVSVLQAHGDDRASAERALADALSRNLPGLGECGQDAQSVLCAAKARALAAYVFILYCKAQESVAVAHKGHDFDHTVFFKEVHFPDLREFLYVNALGTSGNFYPSRA